MNYLHTKRAQALTIIITSSMSTGVAPNSNISYYRLKMIHSDGAISYSNIVAIKNETIKKFTILNNPVINNIIRYQTTSLTKGLYEIQLVNISGKIIQKQSLNLDVTTSNQQLELGNILSKGIYFVRLVGNGISESEKIIIQ